MCTVSSESCSYSSLSQPGVRAQSGAPWRARSRCNNPGQGEYLSAPICSRVPLDSVQCKKVGGYLSTSAGRRHARVTTCSNSCSNFCSNSRGGVCMSLSGACRVACPGLFRVPERSRLLLGSNGLGPARKTRWLSLKIDRCNVRKSYYSK